MAEITDISADIGLQGANDIIAKEEVDIAAKGYSQWVQDSAIEGIELEAESPIIAGEDIYKQAHKIISLCI